MPRLIATIHRLLMMPPGIMVKSAKPRRQRRAIAAAKVPQNKEVSQDGLSEDMIDNA
jgi:hypothetical protein